MATFYPYSNAFFTETGGQNGATVYGYKSSRFTSAPAQGAAPPDSNPPDAGPVTTGTDFGGPGAFTIQCPTWELYYFSITWAGVTYWQEGVPILAEGSQGTLLPSGALELNWYDMDEGGTIPATVNAVRFVDATYPPARLYPGYAYNPITQEVTLFGGSSLSGAYYNDTWVWSAGTGWKQLSPSLSPGARSAPAMCYDQDLGGILLFGGYNPNLTSGDYLDDTWFFDGTTWSELTPANSPSARAWASMAYYPGVGAVLFGGRGTADLAGYINAYLQAKTGQPFNWISASSVSYTSWESPSMAWDSSNARMIVFGGIVNSIGGSPTGDTYQLTLVLNSDKSGFGASPGLTQLATTGPSARSGAMMSDHPNNSQGYGGVLLFGGFDGSFLKGDTWFFGGPFSTPGDNVWAQMTPTTAAPASGYGGLAYDIAAEEVVLYIGTEGTAEMVGSETWTTFIKTPTFADTPWTQRGTVGAMTAELPTPVFTDAALPLVLYNERTGTVTLTTPAGWTSQLSSLPTTDDALLVSTDDSQWIQIGGQDPFGPVLTFNTRTGNVTFEASDVEGTFTAKGQLYAGTGSGTGELLSAGTDNYLLVADSSQAAGLRYQSVLSAIEGAFTAKGELLVGTGSGTGELLSVGSDTYVLTADSTQTPGIKWAAAASGGSSFSAPTTLPLNYISGTTTLTGSSQPGQYVVPGASSYNITLPSAPTDGTFFWFVCDNASALIGKAMPKLVAGGLDTINGGANFTLPATGIVVISYVSALKDWKIAAENTENVQFDTSGGALLGGLAEISSDLWLSALVAVQVGNSYQSLLNVTDRAGLGWVNENVTTTTIESLPFVLTDSSGSANAIPPSAFTARAIATTALPTNTYSNGTSGVGATLTATSNAALTVDGISMSAGDRLVLSAESTASHNGIYDVTNAGSGSSAYVLTRSPDFNQPFHIAGRVVYVAQGTVNKGTLWGTDMDPDTTVTIGTTSITFAQLGGGSSAGTLLASVQYAPGSATSYAGSTTAAVVDATNLALTFTAPATGDVILSFEFSAASTDTSARTLTVGFSTASGSYTAIGYTTEVALQPNDQSNFRVTTKVTGLTAGSSYTIYPWFLISAGTSVAIVAGGNTALPPTLSQTAPAVLTAWAA